MESPSTSVAPAEPARPDGDMLELRPARLEDAPDLARLVTQLGYPVEPERMGPRLTALLAREGHGTWLAVAGGRPVGMIGFELKPSYASDEPEAWIQVLVVDERARGRGVGRRLVRRAEELSRAAGARRIVVTSRIDRADAHRFYEGLGYAHTGVRMARAFPDTPASPGSVS